MKSPFRKLEELQHDLGEIAVQITKTQFFHFHVPQGWRPAINAFRCGDRFMVCVELAGVDKESIDLRAEPLRLTIRGRRATPEPSCDDRAVQTLAIEIDDGPF